MTLEAFIAEALPFAERASSSTRVRVSVILAQWIDEVWDPATQSPGPDWTVKHNPGNVSPGGVVATYPNLTAGVDAWEGTMLGPLYAPVRVAPTAVGQAVALGARAYRPAINH